MAKKQKKGTNDQSQAPAYLTREHLRSTPADLKDLVAFAPATGGGSTSMPDIKALGEVLPKLGDLATAAKQRSNSLRGENEPQSDERELPNLYQIDSSIDVAHKSADASKDDQIRRARILGTTCFRGEYVSLSLRLKEKLGEASAGEVARWVPGNPEFDNDLIADFIFGELDWPSVTTPNGSGPEGLIIVAGSTNSGKTELAQAIALHSLQHGVAKFRESCSENMKRKNADCADEMEGCKRPHLVTYEDPIEDWTFGRLVDEQSQELQAELFSDPAVAASCGFAMTARECGIDVGSLKQALCDARRQSPACFYVGEVRRPGDWKEILEFSSTGHLIVVTTHAASLAECVLRLVQATEATGPADRRRWLGSLKSIIHARLLPTSERKIHQMPAVWLNRDDAGNALVGSGPSTIVADGEVCFSRRQFFDKYLRFRQQQVRDRAGSFDRTTLELPRNVVRAALAAALASDVHELIHS